MVDPVATTAIQEKLAREVLRKLRLATEADNKEDREIICGEVFTDLTGVLDETAQEELGVDGNCKFFEILAPYFSKRWDLAEGLLYVCRRLLSQPYIVPVYALLLYQWLLLNKDAGGAEQRQKHVLVLVSGARQVLWGDVHSSKFHFQPLYDFLYEEVAFNPKRTRLDTLPPQPRAKLLAVVAAFLPYYKPVKALAQALAGFPAPGHTAEDSGHVDGEAADFVVTELTDMLRMMRAEESLLRYLRALVGLRNSPFLARCKRITRLRLQAELYGLTQAGGPRYAPRAVNVAAFAVLDALYPLGQRSRRLVSLLFRFWFHPSEWARATSDAVRTGAGLLWASLASWSTLLLRLSSRIIPVKWGGPRQKKRYAEA